MATLTLESKDLRKVLKENGINLKIEGMKSDAVYIELDEARTVATITPSSDEHTIVRFYPNATFRQTVIQVIEPERTITRTWTVAGARKVGLEGPQVALDRARVNAAGGGGFPVHLPEDRTHYKVTSAEVDEHDSHAHERWMIKVTVEAEVEASQQCFLLGHDEKHMFVSALPEMVRSVKRAHDVLRPPEVPRNAERVGEWFFVPVSQEISDKLDIRIERQAYFEGEAIASDGTGENHLAATLVRNKPYDSREAIDETASANTTYCIGFILDTDRRHTLLWLGEWCRVYRNLELDPPSNMDGGSWD